MSGIVDEAYDRRMHRRVPVDGQARANFGGRWHGCEVVDLSGGGARLRSKIKPLDGATILIQLRGLGIVRAKVVQKDSESFSISFDQKDYEVDSVVDNLMLQANATLMGRDEARVEAHEAEPAVQKAPTRKDKKSARDTDKFLKENQSKRLRSMVGG